MPSYSVELGQRICELIAQDHNLRQIAAMEGMPSTSTIFEWSVKYPEFAESYARARLHQADSVHSGMQAIEDRTIAGEIDPKAANTVLGNMRWRAERLDPKRYGSRVDHSHQGNVSLQVVTAVPDPVAPGST